MTSSIAQYRQSVVSAMVLHPYNPSPTNIPPSIEKPNPRRSPLSVDHAPATPSGGPANIAAVSQNITVEVALVPPRTSVAKAYPSSQHASVSIAVTIAGARRRL